MHYSFGIRRRLIIFNIRTIIIIVCVSIFCWSLLRYSFQQIEIFFFFFIPWAFRWCPIENQNPEGFFHARAHGFDCCQIRVPAGYPGLAYAAPNGGVNSAKISSVDLHIKLTPAEQCMHQYILHLCYRQPIDLI